MTTRNETTETEPIGVLVIDDEPGMIEALTIGLESRGDFRIVSTTDPAEVDELLDESIDVVLSDIRMPQVGGFTVLERVRTGAENVEVVLMTAYSSVPDAVEAMKYGAFDYVPKPFDVDEIAHKLHRAANMRRLRREVARLRASDAARACAQLLGDSPAIRRVRELVTLAAPSRLPVLLTGESGTGKELAARALHQSSPRQGRPFTAVNCAALPESLVESELFGHVKGAFTGARSDHAGLIASSDGGTVFLDEVGELTPPVQAKLLRVIEDGEVRPVGAVHAARVDVRFIAATNHELEDDVPTGQFRKDLFYRLNGITIALPPLRLRQGDVPLLAHHALDRACRRENRPVARFSPSAMELLERYSWPGNVRELIAVVERAQVLCRDDVIEPRNLPDGLTRHVSTETATADRSGTESFVSLDAATSRHIEAVLRHTRGNVTAAAQILQVPRTTLISRMERLGLRSPSGAEAASSGRSEQSEP